MKREYALSALLLAACATERPNPLPSSARVRLARSRGNVAPAAPIRYAVVWATRHGTSKGFHVTDDGALGSIDDVFDVALDLPDESVRRAAVPVEATNVVASVWTRSYRPRIVIYTDEDRNGSFNPSVLGGTGPDTILGVDGTYATAPTALLDLDGLLRTLTIPETATFYDFTGGRYTAFVWTEASSYLRSISPPQPELVVEVTVGGSASADLDCYRSLQYGSQTANGLATGLAIQNTHVRAVVDSSLDTRSICGVTITDCSSSDLRTSASPALDTPTSGDTRRLVQCRTTSSYEFLLVLESNVSCENCTCSTTARTTLFVTTRAVEPPWWPCGSDVPYCVSDLPAYSFDTRCLTATDGGAPEAGISARDAGPD